MIDAFVEKDIKKSKKVEPTVEPIRFLVWFTGALDRFEGLKAHHLTPIKVYFQEIGLGEPEPIESYDQALIKYGYTLKGRK